MDCSPSYLVCSYLGLHMTTTPLEDNLRAGSIYNDNSIGSHDSDSQLGTTRVISGARMVYIYIGLACPKRPPNLEGDNVTAK